MEDNNVKEEAKAEPTANIEDGNITSTTPLIDQANKAAQRMEEANKKMEENLARQEEIMAKQTLAGQSDAGQESSPKEEISNAEYAKQVLEGKLN